MNEFSKMKLININTSIINAPNIALKQGIEAQYHVVVIESCGHTYIKHHDHEQGYNHQIFMTKILS